VPHTNVLRVVATARMGATMKTATPDSTKKSRRALSVREKQVVVLLVEGKTNKEIAGALGLSIRTVELYRVRVYRKLEAKGVSDVVRYAVRHGMIEP